MTPKTCSLVAINLSCNQVAIPKLQEQHYKKNYGKTPLHIAPNQNHLEYTNPTNTELHSTLGIAHICFKQWFQITADAHPGVSGVSKDQKFCEKFKNTHCQVDHPAKIE